MCNSSTIKLHIILVISVITVTAAEAAIKKQLSGNEERGGGGISGKRGLIYEQGGSSDRVRGLQGGTVLKERKAKMEGS